MPRSPLHPLTRLITALLLALPVPVLAQSPAPETSLAPPQKPDVSPAPDATPDAAPETTEVPPPKPVAVDPAQPLATKESAEDRADAEDTPEAQAPKADPEAFRICTAALKATGAVFEAKPRMADADDSACGIAEPVLLEQAAPGVAMQPDTLVRCETALALAAWLKRVVIPASEVLSERGAVSGVQHGSSYVCRRRNNLPEGKLSEHAFGSAIDVMGLSFADGSTLNIEPRERDGTLEEAFQDAIRAGACLSFTTVLGPGSDASHDDHLHFDIKARNGGFRLCQ